MFIHFGMSTFDGDELSLGDKPSTVYAPAALDVDQWIQVARDAGMRYAILTAKHHSGHCLWPSRHTDYHVGTSSNRTDVVEAFVKACGRHGILPGLYYASWDNHHTFGSITPSFVPHGNQPFTTQAYRDFQAAQIEELLTRYGPLAEVWIDIPDMLGHEGRRRQYQQIASLQPDALILMNNGMGDGIQLNYDRSWPTDLLSIERKLPARMARHGGFRAWRTLSERRDEPAKEYYIPGEVCDTIGDEWFYTDADLPRSVQELLGMRLICAQRGVNLLLNVPPDRQGRIAARYIEALNELARQFHRTQG
jgi:alpha-L-fucosidase